MKKLSLLTGILLAAYCYTTGQAIKIPFDQDKWEAFRATMKPETYMGKEGILLDSGVIYTKNVDFTDGIIEVDMNFPQQRYFPGLAFRVQDNNNYESFYVRPHQSGNPDATQYTPVFNGQAGWQLYHGPGYSSAIAFSFNTWHHIKIDIHGLQAEIYMDDMQKPLIKVTELKRAWKGGNIGLSAGGALVHFANLQYTPKEGPAPTAMPIPASGTGGMITQWQISNVVSSNLFEKKYQLTPELKRQFAFTTQRSEPSGTINLSRWGQVTKENNTIVAKVHIYSATEQVKPLLFGFSDGVTIYLNDKALYAGSDIFMSRDYRFLGTIGFFDTLFLPLKKGDNELWLVVSEVFGGWGVKAKFENMDNISLK